MPVGCSLEDVPNGPDNITKSDLVIVNGEGSLHHDKPCIESIFSAAKYAIGQGKRVFLINALWQDGGIEKHRSTLESLAGIYVRDTASQLELAADDIESHMVPDMTYYSGSRSCYERRMAENRTIGITDSVSHATSALLYEYTKRYSNALFLPIISQINDTEIGGSVKNFKRHFYPWLYQISGRRIDCRQYYKSLCYASQNTDAYISRLKSCYLMVNGRYHSLCFCIQNEIPFVALASNSRKVEALLDDIGLNKKTYMIDVSEVENYLLPESSAVRRAVSQFTDDLPAIRRFNKVARNSIATMIDTISE
jgi:hypothetical protein